MNAYSQTGGCFPRPGRGSDPDGARTGSAALHRALDRGRCGAPPFSGAVEVGKTLYLSGDIGVDATNRVPDTAEAEATLLLQNVQRTLKQAGYTMDDLVTVTVYCSDVKHYDAFNAVYRTYFKKEFPARAFIGAGTLLFNARFEMQGIAVRRLPAGLRPWDSPTRSLARRGAGALRSRGSLAILARIVSPNGR